jgi:ABC-type polysaccharide/polyol phosphate export permease
MSLPTSSAPGAPPPGAAPEPAWIGVSPPRLVDIARRVAAFPRLIAEHKDLVITSVQRELRGQFTGTLLGWAWPLVQPLFLFAVYYLIFTQVLGMKMHGLTPELEAAMGVYMFVGVAVWAAFGDSLARGTGVIVANGNLIKKLAFPSETLPLNLVLVNLITMLCALLAFFLVVAGSHVAGRPLWPWPDPLDLLWIPPLLLVQALFTYGLALFLSTLYVFLRDTQQIIGLVVTVWMFVTPVFWVPNKRVMDIADWVLPYVQWNPLYHLIYAWRVVVMNGQPDFVFPGSIAASVGIFALWALASFVLGYAFFTVSQRRFADEV